MKHPRFRLYMERRVLKGSAEPNLHIIGQPPFDPWPHVLSPGDVEVAEPAPFNKFKAVAHLCPPSLKDLLSDDGEAPERHGTRTEILGEADEGDSSALPSEVRGLSRTIC